MHVLRLNKIFVNVREFILWIIVKKNILNFKIYIRYNTLFLFKLLRRIYEYRVIFSINNIFLQFLVFFNLFFFCVTWINLRLQCKFLTQNFVIWKIPHAWKIVSPWKKSSSPLGNKSLELFFFVTANCSYRNHNHILFHFEKNSL